MTNEIENGLRKIASIGMPNPIIGKALDTLRALIENERRSDAFSNAKENGDGV